jgi:N-acetylneuraminic acid mutarotase
VICSAPVIEITRLPDYPHPDGIAGAMAGTIDGHLIVCGGTHFANKTPPWEGGKKQWLDDILLLKSPEGTWEKAGTLTTPLAHASAVPVPQGILLIGGCDATRHFADVRLLTRTPEGNLVEKIFPALPQPLAYGAAVLLDDIVYVAGGLENPESTETSSAFFALNLKSNPPRWIALPPLPGSSRMLASLGAAGGKIYLAGGVALSKNQDGSASRRYLSDAWSYTPASTGENGVWSQLPDLPHWVAGAVTPIPEIQNEKVALIGGDARENPAAAPSSVTAFSKDIYFFDSKTNTWTSETALPEGRAVSASCVWADGVVVIGGEPRPGYRAREAYLIKAAD